MRRITNACLLQTMKFDTTNGANPEKDLEEYCEKMDHRKTKYIIEEKTKVQDGSLVVKVKKQYNVYPIEGYF